MIERLWGPEYRDALESARGVEPTANAISRQAAEFGPEAARWAFLQHSLRRAARTKFSRADEMLFTRPGLEMATHERIAAWHASLFAPGEPVTDLTCGIGSDAMALASRGPVTAWEVDEETVRCATWNLSLEGSEPPWRGDSTAQEPEGAIWIDPARRNSSGRFYRISDLVPPLTPLLPWLRDGRTAAAKLSPMFRDEDLAELGGDLTFVSFGRECREALVRWPGEGRDVECLHVETGERIVTGPAPSVVREPGKFIYEADPAAIRAHCLGQFGLEQLGDSPGYLTGDDRLLSPWLVGYTVLASDIWRAETVRTWLRAHDRRIDTVKLRGVQEEPDQVRARLKMKGGEPATLILYPCGPQVRFAIVLREP